LGSFVDRVFTGGPMPRSADLAIAKRKDAGFERLANAGKLLACVNTRALEYAPATSADGLELFFTRLELDMNPPRVRILHTISGSRALLVRADGWIVAQE
jgi:hypothetical protein